jgi:hypothetical protein
MKEKYHEEHEVCNATNAPLPFSHGMRNFVAF